MQQKQQRTAETNKLFFMQRLFIINTISSEYTINTSLFTFLFLLAYFSKTNTPWLARQNF
jgi:hypothetical protein